MRRGELVSARILTGFLESRARRRHQIQCPTGDFCGDSCQSIITIRYKSNTSPAILTVSGLQFLQSGQPVQVSLGYVGDVVPGQVPATHNTKGSHYTIALCFSATRHMRSRDEILARCTHKSAHSCKKNIRIRHASDPNILINAKQRHAKIFAGSRRARNDDLIKFL